MPLIDIAIVNLCVVAASSNINGPACNKAVEAYSKQSGLYQTLADTESKTTDYATIQGNKYLGHETMYILSAAGFTYKTVENKSLTFRLPRLDVFDSVSNTITPTSYTVNLGWNLNWLK